MCIYYQKFSLGSFAALRAVGGPALLNIHMLIRELITEAAYDSMVDAMQRRYPDQVEFIQDQVRAARQSLKKADRVTWYLRVIDAYLSGAVDSVAGRYNFTTFQKLQSDILHFFGYNYAPIDNYQFGRQTISQVIDDLKALERQWQEQAEKTRGVDPQEGDYRLFEFGDGTAWWFVDRAYCPEEGRSGGHCGNVDGKRETDQRILSLRNRNNQVILTFILESDGNLGEMKAKYNQKPSAKYHPHIMKLLLWDQVQGIHGQGYAPQNNFNVFDLGARDLEYLDSVKPKLIVDQISEDNTSLLSCQSDAVRKKYLTKVPNHLQPLILDPSTKNWEHAVARDPFLILHAPVDILGYDDTVIKLAKESNYGMHVDIIGQLPKQKREDLDLIKEILIHDASQIDYLNGIEDPEIKIMNSMNPYAHGFRTLADIPRAQRTLAVCRFAVLQNEDDIDLVPKKYREQIQAELDN